MTILQRYLFREWLFTLLAVSIVLLIVLMGVFLGELLNDIADGRAPAGLLGLQIVLQLPRAMNSILPLSAFVAVMWGLGRLYRDQEMAVMRSNGFGWRQMIRPLLTLMVPVSLILLYVGFALAPASGALAERKLEEAFKSATLWGLQAGHFHVLQKGDFVVYVESIAEDGRSLNNIFVQQRADDWDRIWIAQKGEYWLDNETGQRYLTLLDGQITDSQIRPSPVRMLTFARNDLRLPEPERTRRKVALESQPSAELLEDGGSAASAELQWRAAPSILVLVLALLAIPLAHSSPREGRGSRIVLGILAYAVYANVLHLCRAWIVEETLPAGLGMWWVHGVVGLVALLLLQRQGRMVGSG